jgi:hypothetical protein
VTSDSRAHQTHLFSGLKHYIPEVESVEQVLDEAEVVAEKAFKELEMSLHGKK